MTEFTIKVAEVVMGVRVHYPSTRCFCREYLHDGQHDLSIGITEADLAYEEQECIRLGIHWDSGPVLEVSAVLRKVSEALLAYDTLLFHGSCIAVDGQAYLFTAPSGTGKSTHTRLWRELLGSRAVMVNDDKPFLTVGEEVVTAWGSPWCGRYGLQTNIAVPLKAICILERGVENRIRSIPARDAVFALLKQSFRPRNAAQMPQYMALLDRLSSRVQFFRMECNMDPAAALVAYGAMFGSNT